MARPLRIEFEDAIYHVTARGNERRPVFRGESDRRQFLNLLARSCERSEVSLLVFVLMGNHFHLVAQTSVAPLGIYIAPRICSLIRRCLSALEDGFG